jgi:hypothetical protein
MVTATSLNRLLLIACILTIILSSISLAAQNPVGIWKLDEGSGDMAYDSSGGGHSATLSSGMRWSKASSAWALSTDGLHRGYVTTPTLDLTGSKAVTVTLWLEHSFSTTNGESVLFEAGTNYLQSETGFALLIDNDTCHGFQAVLRGNEGTTANCYAQPSTSGWHHLTAVYDKSQTGGNAVSLYLDGALQTPTWNLSSATNTNNFGNLPLYLLSRGGSSRFSSGTVSDLRVYDGALGNDQVQEIYNDDPSPTAISYVQGNYADPQSPQTTVTVPFTAAQTAGDLNVVVVAWKDSTATVRQITDSTGNTYTRAVGPTVVSGIATQSIYYAKNIVSAAAGSNIVTVSFSGSAKNPDIRVLEYSGADTTSPIDVTSASTGNGRACNSGAANTTNATDLILGANVALAITSGPGTGFTKRLLSAPQGNIVEDQYVTATGGYSASAPLLPAGTWIMQMVALRHRQPTLTSITVTPATASISVGGHQQFTATGNYSDGSHQNLTNSATWTSSSPSIATVSSGGLASGVAAGTTTIKAASGSIYGTASLTVTAGGTFSISASPSSLSILQGNQSHSTITTVVSNGFNSSITLSASGVPSGTTVSFNPTTIAAPGSGSSTMTITVGSSTPLGTYPITVAGNGGGVQQTTTVTVTVTAAATFTISASPASLSVLQGHAGSSTLTTTGVNGFNSSISLSASGTPTGTTVSFNPNPIPAPGTGISTMTITVGSSTPAGTYPITVTANGGGTQQAVVVTLTVTTSGTISYVQGAYATPQSSQTTVSVAYSNAQTVGDLNVIAVGWNDTTATVSSVQDSKGNVYTRAVGPTSVSGTLSQSIYYAKNIAAAAAGSNTVTVTFSTAAYAADIRIAEYSGADPTNPVDVTAANSGSSASSSSGSATTTNPTDLIFGANIVATLTTGPGSGFTKRVITSPDGDIVEDEMVTTTGGYSATAPLSAAGAWVMQMVAFRASGGAPVLTSITVTPANPSIAVNGQQQFTATGNYSDGSHQNLTGSSTWTSSSPSVATITSGGLATGVAAGTTTIKAVSGSVSGSTGLTVTGSGTFTVAANPASISIAQGNQNTSTITTTVSGGFNSAITLSASGVPSGTSVSFNPASLPAPGSGSSVMTIVVGSGTAAGTYPITVAGNGGGIQQTATVTLTVTAVANFSISASPASLSVVQGRQGTSTLTTTISNGFNSAISLSASGAPTGTTISFNPASIPAPGSGTSVMTITVGSSTHMGTYPITITATAGSIHQTVTVTLTVTAQIALSWSSGGSPNLAGYNIYRSTTSGGPYSKINSSLDPNMSYMDQGAQEGVTYYYVTTSVDTSGNESSYSNQASAMLP